MTENAPILASISFTLAQFVLPLMLGILSNMQHARYKVCQKIMIGTLYLHITVK